MKPAEFLYLYRVYLGWCYQEGISDKSASLGLGDLVQEVYRTVPPEQYSSLYDLSFHATPVL